MDYLREGIHLRGFAQIEPLVAYKNEGFTLFQDLMNTIWSDFARMVYNVEVQVDSGEQEAEPPQAVPQSPTRNSSWTGGGFTYSGSASSTMAPYSAMTTDPDAAALTAGEQPQPELDDEPEAPQVEQRRVDAIDQIGRNDPCWCGSGKKYKKCHGV
jgi:preprotein translocase subunit SecA